MRTSTATAPPPGRGVWYVGAEASCLVLGLALAASTTRLFSNTGAPMTLAAVAAAAWLLALALRRSPLPPLIGDLTHLILGAGILLWVVAPEARFGPLPTPGSLSVLAEVVRDDFSVFNDDIAPMAARTGHLAVLAALVWVLALFCSTTAMRLRAPVQAALPHIVAIVGLGFVSRDEARASTAAVLVAAVALYCLAQGAWRNAAYRWQPPGAPAVTRSLAAGAVVLVVAALVSAVLTPLSPARPDPVLDLRRGGLGDGGGPRTVVSPFVEVGSNLGARSNELLFQGATDSPGYWRLTSLEDYDPDSALWALANSYERVEGGVLDTPTREAGLGTAAVDIVGLGGIWVPTPADPVSVESSVELNWDPESRSLVNRSGDVASGDTFDFTTDPEVVSPATLAGAPAVTDDTGLLDSSGVPAELETTARDLTAGLSPYAAALALQDWFRGEFDYDETVDYSSSPDPLAAFVDQRSGFCQQFSTAFALAARSVGLPARVVVGFTTGEAVADAPGTFAVYGRNAHAWPEVLFSGIGWVSFEPTPGRGNPATTGITGVPPAQADPSPEDPGEAATTAPTDPPATTPAPAAGDGETAPSDNGSVRTTQPGPETGGGASRLLLVAALVLLGAGIAAAIWFRRRPDPGAVPADPVRSAWLEACRLVEGCAPEGSDWRPAASETPLEFATRVGDGTGIRSIRELAEMETVRRWSPVGTDASGAAEAATLLEALRSEVAALPESTAGREHEPV